MFAVLRKQMFKESANGPRNDGRGVREMAKTIQAKYRDEHGNSAPYTRKLVESSRKRRGWLCVDGKWQQGPNGVTGQGDPGPSPTKSGRPKKVKTQVVSNTTAVATCDDPAAVANGGTDGGETADLRRAREKKLLKALRAAQGKANTEQRRHDREIVGKDGRIALLARKLEAAGSEPSVEDSMQAKRFADREEATTLRAEVAELRRKKPPARVASVQGQAAEADCSESCCAAKRTIIIRLFELCVPPTHSRCSYGLLGSLGSREMCVATMATGPRAGLLGPRLRCREWKTLVCRKQRWREFLGLDCPGAMQLARLIPGFPNHRSVIGTPQRTR
jgi:hypothetical protein